MISLVFENVVKCIRGKTIIDHVSFEMTSGKIYGLKGINGSGKTMIMRLIAGLIYPTSGRVIVNDQILGKDISFPPSIGYLIENPAFLGEYTGLENLIMINSLKRRATFEEIRHTLEEVGLDPDDRRKYRKYSLGMKQRLGLAAALFEHPEIILLDEPTNALDTEGVERAMSLIKEKKDEKTLIIMSCHDEKILTELSDKVFAVENGSVTEQTMEVKREK